MFFYCFKFDKESCELTTIVMLFGKFWYQRLPIGIKVSPGYAQALIKKILKGLDVDYYIDDMGIWTNGTINFHF